MCEQIIEYWIKCLHSLYKHTHTHTHTHTSIQTIPHSSAVWGVGFSTVHQYKTVRQQNNTTHCEDMKYDALLISYLFKTQLLKLQSHWNNQMLGAFLKGFNLLDTSLDPCYIFITASQMCSSTISTGLLVFKRTPPPPQERLVCELSKELVVVFSFK